MSGAAVCSGAATKLHRSIQNNAGPQILKTSFTTCKKSSNNIAISDTVTIYRYTNAEFLLLNQNTHSTYTIYSHINCHFKQHPIIYLSTHSQKLHYEGSSIEHHQDIPCHRHHTNHLNSSIPYTGQVKHSMDTWVKGISEGQKQPENIGRLPNHTHSIISCLSN